MQSGPAMQAYLDLDGGSGVVPYRLGKGWIVFVFAGRPGTDGRFYRYTDASCGAAAIGAMQALAKAMRGLSTYVAQRDPAYESRWH